MGLLLAFLKMLGTAAAKGVVGLGKAAVTGAKIGVKGIGTLAKAGLRNTQAGKLTTAFAGMGGGGGNTAQELKGTAFDPEKYGIENMQKLPQGQGFMPAESGSFEEQSNVLNPMRNIVVPGPGGRPIQGQGEALPGYEMQPPQYKIPPAYLNMMQQQSQQPQQQIGRYPGVFAGLKEGFLGMPSTAGEPQPSEQGRQTAYYMGKLIPDIIRSKMGVSTTGEEARQQQMLEAYGTKRITPEYKKDLQEATIRLSNPNLSETDKVMIYQQLVTVYPERSAEIKRIIFPQSQDNFDDLLKGIIAGNIYGR